MWIVHVVEAKCTLLLTLYIQMWVLQQVFCSENPAPLLVYITLHVHVYVMWNIFVL